MSEQLNRWLGKVYAYATRWGLSPTAAETYTWLVYAGSYYGKPLPRIISGWRSDALTASLQARWDSGDRLGLAVRPVSDSKHLTGDAFDLGGVSIDVLVWYGRLAPYFPAMAWGGNFQNTDPNHWQTNRRRGVYGG